MSRQASSPSSNWVTPFYELQEKLTGCYSTDLHPAHADQVQTLRRFTRLLDDTSARVLELGAGGGQFAVAAALDGLDVTALELRDSGTAHTRQLADQHGVKVEAITGDFYSIELPNFYSSLCYWDGFGVGTDEEQQHLLRRVRHWLVPGGRALLEVYMRVTQFCVGGVKPR